MAGSNAKQGLTLEEYAAHKQLPVEHLRELRLSTSTRDQRPSVRIPFLDEGGVEVAVCYRTAVNGSNRFRFRSGDKPTLYGLWMLSEFSAGWCIAVEGYSDWQTMRLYNLPVLAFPGAHFKESWAKHFESFNSIYLIKEPDQGGQNLQRQLSRSALKDRIRIVSLQPHKDVSELHCDDPDKFRGRLAGAVKQAVRLADRLTAEKEAERAAERAEAWSQCRKLARRRNLVKLFLSDLRQSGVVGERRAAILLFLILITRVLMKPVSAAIKAPSSAGKSYLLRQVLRFFPPEAFYSLTAMSPKALVYSKEPLQHRFLVIEEAAGIEGDFVRYAVRSLLSEGRVRYETVVKTAKEPSPVLIDRKGPTGLLVTTTALELHGETETRILAVPIDDSAAQTQDILEMQARLANDENLAVDLGRWHALQSYICLGPTKVYVPYAKRLARLIPPRAVRLRRDFPAILSLIQASALLRQERRSKDPQGRIVASVADYKLVRWLVCDLVSVGVESAVSETIRGTVAAVQNLASGSSGGGGVAIKQLALELNLDRSSVYRRVRAAIEAEYLVNKAKENQPYQLEVGDALPADVQVLPKPGDLR